MLTSDSLVCDTQQAPREYLQMTLWMSEPRATGRERLRESSVWPGLSSFYCGGLGPAVRLAPCELGTLSPRRGRSHQGRGRKSQSDESLYWWPSRVEGNGEVLLGRQQTDQFANVLWSLEGHTVFWEISPCSLGMVSSSSFLPH